MVGAQRDYYLAAPAQPGAYRVRTKVLAAQAKNKLAFDAPLSPGNYELSLAGGSPCTEQTIVLSVPLSAGTYEFAISAEGCARYDFAFHDARPSKEYRYTLQAPVARRVFRLEMPGKS